MDFRKVEYCRICKSSNILSYLYLGSVPLANSLSDSQSHQKTYPIEVLLCQDCYLSQLNIVVDPKIMYSDYAYHSSISETFKKHCYDLAIKLKTEFHPSEYPLVMDIASNDGCLLTQFKKAGFQRFLGFEPAKNLASEPYGWQKGELPTSLGIPVHNDFFCEKSASRCMAAGRADFIIAQNVLAHVDDLDDFLRGIKLCTYDDVKAVFIAEFPYMGDLIANTQLDTIYHEHLSYFLLKPLVHLFNTHNLPIFRVERLPIHGGSIRIYASKNHYPVESSVTELLESEQANGLYNPSTYVDFSVNTYAIGEDLLQWLEDIYDEGKKIMGYGASAKGISLLNYFGIGNDRIHSIVDETPYKQGKLTPGSQIPIVDFSHFEKEKPDYILLLAWNFAPELIAKTKHLGAKYLVPIPEVKLL